MRDATFACPGVTVRVVPAGVHGNFRIDVPGMMAALTLASLPTILFFLGAQEKVIKGLAAGALTAQ